MRHPVRLLALVAVLAAGFSVPFITSATGSDRSAAGKPHAGQKCNPKKKAPAGYKCKKNKKGNWVLVKSGGSGAHGTTTTETPATTSQPPATTTETPATTASQPPATTTEH